MNEDSCGISMQTSEVANNNSASEHMITHTLELSNSNSYYDIENIENMDVSYCSIIDTSQSNKENG